MSEVEKPINGITKEEKKGAISIVATGQAF
jgi:hypothetical protein